ncbi:GvpL/GvpF family gas vesicle protein [Spirillospora sp. NPDC048911]|uniref:GvpL/GvpF family gas vesicle protein n=1 Tax=Spirillospora sp. NPDC048911 TaxID=3364527 RepID=UPI0037106C4E
MTGPTGPGGGTAVYLYGVSRGLDPAALPALTGVGGAPVRAVTAGDLTALVSTVNEADYGEDALRANLEDLAFLEATARAHHDVVDQAARTAPTAPVRIATLYRDDERVTLLLTERHDTFTRALDRITGRSEWGVKAYAYAEALAAAPAAPAAPAREAAATAGGPGAGAAYLRNRQAQRKQREDAGRRVTAQAQDIHAELAGHAVATRQHPPQDPKLSGHDGTQILNVAYLLDDDQVEGFLAAVKDIDARLPGIGAEVTGPWPPYSFIDTADAAGGAGERR